MTPPAAAASFKALAAPLVDGGGSALPLVGYCMHALATTTLDRVDVRWAGGPPVVGADEVLLVLGPATRHCAFLGGAGGPRVDHVERRRADVLVHVRFQPPLTWSSALVPRPSPNGRLVLVVHGSIMRPPGKWNDAHEHVLPLNGPVGASKSSDSGF